MKKAVMLFMVCLLSVMFTGCGSMHNVTNRVDATGMDFTTAKKGKDCAYMLFGLIPLTKTDIDEAAKKANITSLGYVEYSYGSYLLVGERCVVVYGK